MMINRAILLLPFLAACGSEQTYRVTDAPLETHGQVDLARYQGLWYEIARYPNRFEEGCVGVTAEYSLNEDGSIRVENTCREGALDGPVDVAEGRATAASPENDKLEVGFVWWLPFAVGDYWILSVTEDYSVAVIGAPSGEYGWILAREPELTDEQLQAAYAVFQKNGYDTTQLYLTPQAPL
ncbi:MAG: lipocalin family protein [Pseudomonadota bacterium]